MPYKVFGSENSPYSIKVRAYFRYKGIPHEWLIRNAKTSAEFQKVAKLPIIPAVATPEGKGMQDSTPIIESLEAQFPEPSIHPADPTLRFISELLEEWGDEWGNKEMFHFRWARDVDQRAVAQRLAAEMADGAPAEAVAQMAEMIRKRMIGRGFAVGSNDRTAPVIEQSFKDSVTLLESHLATRPFLFGSRPAFADFGVAMQIYEALLDPTAGDILRNVAPKVCAWCERMLDPKPEGDFEAWGSLCETMEPLLNHIRVFLLWSDANSKAVLSGAKEMTLDLGGRTWWQTVGGPQKYQEKTLRELRRKFQAVSGDAALIDILGRCGCLEVLQGGAIAKL